MKPDRTPPDASTVCFPQLCHYYKRKQQERRKIRQQRKKHRVGCLLHPLHVLSKATMSAAAAIAAAASRASAAGRRAADAQTATGTIRVSLRASSTVYVFR